MASGSLNVDTLSVYRTLPLQRDVIPYVQNTIFSVGPSSFLEGYSFYSTFIINNYMDPSTMSTFIISSLNQALTSTLKSNEINKVSTLTVSDFTSTNTNVVSYNNLVIRTPPINLGLFSNIINTNKYDVMVQGKYSLFLNSFTPPDTYAYVSTVGVFDNLTPTNIGQTTTTRVGTGVYTEINTNLYFSLLRTGVYPLSIPQNLSNFHYEIYLRSPTNNTNNTPNFDLYITGANNYMFTLIPNQSFS
jgi:hypothetical protein